MTATTNENKQHNVMNPDKRSKMITENVEERDKTEGKHDVNTGENQNGDQKTEEKCDAVVTEANKDCDEETEEKCDAVVTEAKQNGDEKTEGKRDAVVTEAKQNGDEKTEEKCDAVVTEAKQNGDEKTEGKSDVSLSDDSCSSERNYMKKTDSYNSETKDTTESSSSEENKKVQCDIEIDSEVQEIQQTTDKCDVKTKVVQCDIEIDSEVQEIQQTTDKHDVKTKAVQDVDDEKRERPDSPDNSMIKMSRKRCTIVDKVPRRREETRSQYRCNLARKFIKTDYRYKRSPNVGPELDFFEDDEGDESYKSDTTYKTATSTSTSTNSCDKDSDDNSNSEESVLYVTIPFHVHYLSALSIHKVNYIMIYLHNAFFYITLFIDYYC